MEHPKYNLFTLTNPQNHPAQNTVNTQKLGPSHGPQNGFRKAQRKPGPHTGPLPSGGAWAPVAQAAGGSRQIATCRVFFAADSLSEALPASKNFPGSYKIGPKSGSHLRSKKRTPKWGTTLKFSFQFLL